MDQSLQNADMKKNQQRLVAWIHACGISLTKKLYGQIKFSHDGTEEFTSHMDWELHQRLEINTRLDGVSRELIYRSRNDSDLTKLKKSWWTRVLLNKRGMLAIIENTYEENVGRSMYDQQVDRTGLTEALRDVKLDNACSGMRRVQWSTECKGKHDQKAVCASLWIRMLCNNSFNKALNQLRNGDNLSRILRQTLHVHSDFLRMLIARDLAVLLPALVPQASVNSCTVVGQGAEDVLVKCTLGPRDQFRDKKGKCHYTTACKETFNERLRWLHNDLLRLLDPKMIRLVVPQGWTLDLTENACCELRRWDYARNHRKRDGSYDERQQIRLTEVWSTWKELGFLAPPDLCVLKHIHVSKPTEDSDQSCFIPNVLLQATASSLCNTEVFPEEHLAQLWDDAARYAKDVDAFNDKWGSGAHLYFPELLEEKRKWMKRQIHEIEEQDGPPYKWKRRSFT